MYVYIFNTNGELRSVSSLKVSLHVSIHSIAAQGKRGNSPVPPEGESPGGGILPEGNSPGGGILPEGNSPGGGNWLGNSPAGGMRGECPAGGNASTVQIPLPATGIITN